MATYKKLAQALSLAGIDVRENWPLAPYTTFKIGGPAALFGAVSSLAQIETALKLAQQASVRVYLLGKGSNTLFSDAGFDGLVLHMASGAVRSLPEKPHMLEADAGTGLSALCLAAQKLSLSGLEFAYGIPGSVGGAVYMNAGAYGGEMADVVAEVDCLEPDGTVCTLTRDQLGFGYRTSRFEKQGGVILRARFSLHNALQQEIRAKMEELLARRKEKQPLDKPSAGSTFKRPAGAYAAALIDQCGLKGYRVGGAAISEKHAGFVVNLGGATCADVVAVADYAAAVVKEKTGYTLEREIRVVG